MIEPRRPVDRPPLPVLAVCHLDGECMLDGELFSLAALPARLAERPPGRVDMQQIPAALVATDDPAELLATLDRRFGRQDAPNFMLWQWSLSLRPATVWLGAGETTAYEALTPHLSWFGWAARRGTFHRKGGARRYAVLDVYAWTDAGKILDGYAGSMVAQLARFATDLQAFCREQHARTVTTAAALASVMLRDPRFWPRAGRRKVPRATNDRARRQLPGNHYRLLSLSRAGQPSRVHGAVLELDQIAAHHAAALNQPFPASSDLYAWGRFYADPRKLRITDCVATAEQVTGEHGLLLAAVRGTRDSRALADDPLTLPAAAHHGVRWRHVWTSETGLLERCGAEIVGVAAGWTTNQVDEGLNAYAWHALAELQAADPARKSWLKQALLATYGLLAAKPREFRQLNRWGDGDQMTVTMHTGQNLHGRLRVVGETESQTCNVIWRGLIEARVRAETVSYARELRDAGRRVISLYADAVYIAAAGGDPPPRAGWRVTQELTHVQFTTPTAFTSDQVVKAPGVPREARTG